MGKEEKVLEQPLFMYLRKNFQLSYKDLEKHIVRVDMWTVSSWTFNEYFGVGKETLNKVANRTPDSTLMLKRKLSRKQQEDQKKKRGIVPHVASFGCTINVEEVFMYTLSVENFKLKLDRNLQNGDARQKGEQTRPYRLKFDMPKNRKSLPGKARIGHSCHTSALIPAGNIEGGKFWANCGDYHFVGTRTHLQNSYFLVTVYGPAMTGVPSVVSSSKHNPFADSIGQCLMNLTSVLDAPVFEGKVKKWFSMRQDADELTKEQQKEYRERYIAGELSGYVKVNSRSKTLSFDELDFRGVRPEQPKTATSVSHLNKAERHLVVVVDKCQGLPVADIADGCSDPYLRISWNNMVAVSPTMKETLKPVFKYRCYFPVRMAGKMQRTADSERRHRGILKMELESKGPIKIEVYDDDDTTADMLGSCYVHMHDILSSSSDQRSLIGGARKRDDEFVIEQHGKKNPQWYTKGEEVRVYDGSRTQLSGTALLRNEQTPLCFFETYFYPDWQHDLRLDRTEESRERQKWELQVPAWLERHEQHQETYARVFPEAIGAWPCNDETAERAEKLEKKRFRIFSCVDNHPLTSEVVPLMSFLSPIIIPEDDGMPANLLHWMHCLSFETSGQHVRSGRIPRQSWHDPEYVLARRKGTVWDHAILLCSLLLGCKKNAYVCKGMVRRQKHSDRPAHGATEYIEHVWVMTRYHGWVTFWEPTTGQSYHLPRRYKARSKPKVEENRYDVSQSILDESPPEIKDIPEPTFEGILEHTSIEVQDKFLRADELSTLPVSDRRPAAKQKVRRDGTQKGKADAQMMEAERKRLGQAIWPNQEVLVEDKTLVYWLPYESIDVVFNSENLWANHQNHHPACITYDLEEPQWAKFISDEQMDDDEDEFHIEPVARQVKVMPEMKPDQVDNLETRLKDELIQNLMLYRLSKGMDTIFHDPPDLIDQIKLFLEIQDLWLQVDPDYVQSRYPGLSQLRGQSEEEEEESSSDDEDSPRRKVSSTRRGQMSRLRTRNTMNLLRKTRGTGVFTTEEQREENTRVKVHDFIKHTLKPRHCNALGSPYFEKGAESFRPYVNKQDELFSKVESKVTTFLDMPDGSWNIKRGMKFEGFPVHFSSPDPDTIRQYLMALPDYRSYIDDKDDDIHYTIACMMKPLQGAILSVWVYIGIMTPVDSDNKDEA